MFDIQIDSEKLVDIINSLDNDNQKILESLKKIRKSIEKLDDEAWNSPEKKKISEELIPFLKLEEDNFKLNFDNYINQLIYTINNYKRNNANLKKDVNNLTDFKE